MRIRALACIASIGSLLAVPATGVALKGLSAWPYKSSGDSGRYSVAIDNAGFDAFNQSFGGYHSVDGYDPCVFDFQSITPPPVQPNEVHQYAVPGCVPVISPWITTKPWQTRNWDLYCPTNAPWSYDYAYLSDQVILESRFQSLSNWGPSERGGPSPVGRTNYYSTNFALKSHHWAWSAACSATEPWLEYNKLDPVASWRYSGATGGPSASKLAPTAASQSREAGGAQTAQAVAATRGPRLRNERVDAKTIHRAFEVDLAPRGAKRYRLGCPSGYTPERPRHGVGWFTAKPPKPALAARVTDEAAPMARGRGIEVRVTTRGIPRKAARLQISVDCAKT